MSTDSLPSEESLVPFPGYERWCSFRKGLETAPAEYKRQKEWTARFVKTIRCACCGEPFSDANVHTPDGWKETQISGMCETCFDDALLEDLQE